MAQVCADRLGLDPERDVSVVQGDTATTPYSPAGTVGSRFASVGGAAVLGASDRIGARLRTLAAHLLEASEDDIVLADGAAAVAGSPSQRIVIPELARLAHTAHDLPDGAEPGLEERLTFEPTGSTYPYGAHAAVVEVDPDTGAVQVLRYVAVSDCGTLLNPMIVEGQIVGGVAQGIGGTLLEELAYDDAGQLLTASFMDYLLPTAADVPPIEIEHLEIPAPGFPGGAKGAGEAGTLAPAAVIAGAVSDALGVDVTELPLSPDAVWRLAKARGRSNELAVEQSEGAT
jgi:carbon-monoxide dehydrogenase large subunit